MPRGSLTFPGAPGALATLLATPPAREPGVVGMLVRRAPRRWYKDAPAIHPDPGDVNDDMAASVPAALHDDPVRRGRAKVRA